MQFPSDEVESLNQPVRRALSRRFGEGRRVEASPKKAQPSHSPPPPQKKKKRKAKKKTWPSLQYKSKVVTVYYKLQLHCYLDW